MSKRGKKLSATDPAAESAATVEEAETLISEEVQEFPGPKPTLVEAIGTWESMSKMIRGRQAELADMLEGAEIIRHFLQREYGITVPSLGPDTGPVPDVTLKHPIPQAEPDPDVRDTSDAYTPPAQGPVYDPVQTGPLGTSKVDQIRKDAGIPGADEKSFGSDIMGRLANVRRAFGG